MPLAPLSGAQRERALAKLLPQNAVLALLPQEVRERLLPHLGLVDLPVGHQLGDSGGRFARAFFPVAGVVSLVHPAAPESAGVAALVGNEGLVGLPTFMGDCARTRATVQCAGYGLALGREQLLEEWARGGSFMRVLMRYGRALAAQMSLLAACRTAHSLEQRLCSMFLMCLARLPGQDATLREDAAARLLGVDAIQLAAALENLNQGGVPVSRQQGMLAAQNTAALQEAACGCSDRVNGEYARALATGGQAAESVATPPADRPGPARNHREVSTARGGTERPHSR